MRNRNLVSLTVAATFALLVYTGVRLYLFPHAPDTAALHTLFALVFSAIVAVHVVNNARPLYIYLLGRRGRRRPTRGLLAVALAVAALWLGFDVDAWGVQEIYRFGAKVRAEQQGAQIGDDNRQTIAVANAAGGSLRVSLRGEKGPAFGYPLFALWMERKDGSGFRTLYLSKTIATSRFEYGQKVGDTWSPGIVRRPQALPVWSHRYGHLDDEGWYLPAPDDPRLDAVSGATPTDGFEIRTSAAIPQGGEFDIYFEVNQSYDWNDVFSKSAFPDDREYHTGQNGQPSLVYWTRIHLDSPKTHYLLQPIGYGHPGGKSGDIVRDLEPITTATEIVPMPVVVIAR